MRFKFTVLCLCAVIMLGLAATQADAQGYRVSVRTTTVVEGGHNQEVGDIRLTYRGAGGGAVDIPVNNTIEITYGGLYVTNDEVSTKNLEGSGISGVEVSAENDADTNVGKVTLDMSGAAVKDGETITLIGIRVDVSGLVDGDDVMATISASGDSDEFGNITTTTGDSITGKVSTVKDGLNVTKVSQISKLVCDDREDLMPSITVEEGFASAWETGAGDGLAQDMDDTHIMITVANVPSAVTKLIWPGEADYMLPDPEDADQTISGAATNPMDNQDRDGDDDTVNPDTVDMLALVADSVTLEDGKATVVYRFEGVLADGDNKAHDDLKNSFTISPQVEVDTAESGGIADVWAQLHPMPKTGDDDDRGMALSYSHAAETMGNGSFVNVSECVTYLLFPYLTCGAHEDWETGVSVANTSMDDMVFPVSDGATPQSGAVTLYGFQRSVMTADGMSGQVPDNPQVHMISQNLAAGDTYTFTCSSVMPGFEGYAIMKAGFRHAHGTAFVLGNFQDGAAIDVAHGYVALVIPDPEFNNMGRGAGGGESLGQ